MLRKYTSKVNNIHWIPFFQTYVEMNDFQYKYVEIKVNDGTITSSPAPIEFAISDACNADVPEFNAKQ